MSYQQLPKSSKFDTLPKDLKDIAEKLIRKKFKIEHEPEVVEKPMRTRPRSSTTRLVQLYSKYCPYSCTLEVDLFDRVYAERKIKNALQKLANRYGYPFEAISGDGYVPPKVVTTSSSIKTPYRQTGWKWGDTAWTNVGMTY